MRSPLQYLALVRHLGVRWAWFRVCYALRRRSGALRRATPAVAWSGVPSAVLRLERASPAPAAIGAVVGAEADAVLAGRFRLFSHRLIEAGAVPGWHRNQLTGEVAPADRHWSELGDFAFGDIKAIWELSRFPWAFPLARAFVRTGEPKYAEGFWRLFADWCERNRPNQGPNWMCGQEATFRLMAVVFAAEAIGVPPAQRELLGRFVVATGRRIAANLDYALSQKNNHGVSECVGLITSALVLPAHSESAGWLARGLRELQAQVAELVYPDGGFSQHSLIYHRVLLHDLAWVKSRLERAGQPVPAWLVAAGRRATEFLMVLVDPATGLAPLYGPNDGTNVLPVADADFLDMRPVLQLAGAIFAGELPLPAGSWDEAVAWLVTEWENCPRAQRQETPADWQAPHAGCAMLANGEGRLFLRCPTYFRHRPSQADMLHVDVWHRGRPIAMDGGSYSYNSTERFAALGTAALHNVLTVDGIEPLRKFSRFLYLPWPRGQAVKEDAGLRASHDGYAELGVQWSRSVVRSGQGTWRVIDRVTGGEGHTLRWHWRLADRSWTLGADFAEVTDETGRYRIGWSGIVATAARLVRADADSTFGWWSPYYGEVQPACSLIIEVSGKAEVQLHTEFIAS